MDTALKHRLTGAVILVFLAVLLLPELLTGRGMNAAQETPSTPDGELRRIEIELGEPAQRTAPPSAPEPMVQLPTPAPRPAPQPELQPQTQPLPAAVAPQAAPEPAPQAQAAAKAVASPPLPAGGGYFVQVGVFSNAAAAERVARRLREQGFTAVVSRYSSGQQMYRVRVGPQADRAAARQVADRLEAIGQKSPFIVAPDP